MIDAGGKVLRRIRITPDWKAFVKGYAGTHRVQIGDIVRCAIEWWIGERAQEKTAKYLASHGRTEGWSMWLPVDLARQVATISDEDGTNDSCVIYTALVLYCEMVLKGTPTSQVLGIANHATALHGSEPGRGKRYMKARP